MSQVAAARLATEPERTIFRARVYLGGDDELVDHCGGPTPRLEHRRAALRQRVAEADPLAGRLVDVQQRRRQVEAVRPVAPIDSEDGYPNAAQRRDQAGERRRRAAVRRD